MMSWSLLARWAYIFGFYSPSDTKEPRQLLTGHQNIMEIAVEISMPLAKEFYTYLVFHGDLQKQET